MSSESTLSLAGTTLSGVEALKDRWAWFVGLGVLLIAGGTVALGSAFLMTVFSMFLLGCLLIASGALESIHAFGCQKWSGFFIDLLTGLLYVVVGFMVVANPGATAVTLTLLIAMFLIFSGLFRALVALTRRYQNWGWLLLHGLVNLLLGVSIWRQWPVSGLWVIGLFVGIDLVFNGWSLVMLGLAARRWPADGAPAGRPA
jgi:uncharacterized membrane protein HdeD (DUF308 family)